MFDRLEKHGLDAAEAKARAVRGRLGAAIERDVPGVRVSADGERIVVEGCGLLRRRLTDPALRWIGGLVR